MSNMKMSETMDRMMAQSIEEAVRALAKDKSDAATDEFVNALLERLGLRANIDEVLYAPRIPMIAAKSADDEVMPPLEQAPASDSESTKSAANADRKRTVSKKMKDTFLAMEGGTDDSLKAAMKVYKAADQAQIDAWGGKWESFARAFLAGECTPAKKSKAPKTAPAAPAKEKAAAAPKEAKNFTWTPTAKKLFTEVVEGNGGAVTDALKSEFVAHVNAMDAETYKAIAPVGHVRAFITSKAPAAAPAAEDDDDEDLEEIEVDGETLTIGVKSGKIFRATEDSGDVQIGVAGAGKFKDVKIPSA